MSRIVYVNGEYLPEEEATISIFDRGFLMADGVYEVTSVLGGRLIDFDEDDCVCIKVETHNHPSAIEPFGGAGTGVGGVIRDVLGTGLAARPVASTDVRVTRS